MPSSDPSHRPSNLDDTKIEAFMDRIDSLQKQHNRSPVELRSSTQMSRPSSLQPQRVVHLTQMSQQWPSSLQQQTVVHFPLAISSDNPTTRRQVQPSSHSLFGPSLISSHLQLGQSLGINPMSSHSQLGQSFGTNPMSPPTMSATQPTLLQNSQQQRPSLPSQPITSATAPMYLQNSHQQQPCLQPQQFRSAMALTGSPTLHQNSHQRRPWLQSQQFRSATAPTGSPTLHENSQQHQPSLSSQPTSDIKAKLKEIEAILTNIVGLEGVKSQIWKWIFRLLQDEKRKALGFDIGPRNALHMAFLGNPGTGKTMIARTLGKVLHLVGLISKDKVTEVQRTDLVGEYIGHTGVKTKKKIKEASGGILFVDEAYRLMPRDMPRDFGIEALEEIMAAMDRKDIVIIFAGYNEEMNRVISANPGFFRRVNNNFYFNDYTLIDMARILHLKMDTKEKDSFTYGYRLDSSCSVEAIAKLIEEHTTEEQRKKLNGGIVDLLLVNALEHLDLRLDVDCIDATSLLTITMEDLEAGLKSLDKSKNQNTGCLPQEKRVNIRTDFGDDLDCLPPSKRQNNSSVDAVYVGSSSGNSNGAISSKENL